MLSPTVFEQYLLEIINRARLDPEGAAAHAGVWLNDGLGGGVISSAPKQPLAMNVFLTEAARANTAWMDATNIHWGSQGEGGLSAMDRMKAAGYLFATPSAAGETRNFHWGDLSETAVEHTFNAMFRDPQERLVLMNGGMREAGIGIAPGDIGSGWDGVYATADLARSGTKTFLLGVAYYDWDLDGSYDTHEGVGGITLTLRDAATGTVSQVTTADAGGYQIALTAGTYDATFSGDGMVAPVHRSIVITTANLKLDLAADMANPIPPPGLLLNGTPSEDWLTGRSGPDVINGFGGADRLYGGAGNDTLFGGAGKDELDGGWGDDVLIGGGSHDTLRGGPGADRFVYLNIVTDRGDMIYDCRPAEGDRVDISAMLPSRAGHDWTSLAASGHVRLAPGDRGIMLQIDADGGGDSWLWVCTFLWLKPEDLGTDFLIG